MCLRDIQQRWPHMLEPHADVLEHMGISDPLVIACECPGLSSKYNDMLAALNYQQVPALNVWSGTHMGHAVCMRPMDMETPGWCLLVFFHPQHAQAAALWKLAWG